MTTFPSCHSDWSSNSAVVHSKLSVELPKAISHERIPEVVHFISHWARETQQNHLDQAHSYEQSPLFIIECSMANGSIPRGCKNPIRSQSLAPSTNLMKRRKQAAPKPATGPTSKAQRQTSQVGHLGWLQKLGIWPQKIDVFSAWKIGCGETAGNIGINDDKCGCGPPLGNEVFVWIESLVMSGPID